jgi:hypothetical protein
VFWVKESCERVRFFLSMRKRLCIVHAMKGEHTPGPWWWHSQDGFESDYNWQCESLESGKGAVFRLEDVYPGYAECGEHLVINVSPADALLICAAPDLLEALKAVDDCRLFYKDSMDFNDAVGEQVKRAIAKAEGTSVE